MFHTARSTREVQDAMEAQRARVRAIRGELAAQDSMIGSKMMPEIHRLSAPGASAPELLAFINTHLSQAQQHRHAIARKLALEEYAAECMEKKMQGDAYRSLVKAEALAAEETALIAHAKANLSPSIKANLQAFIEADPSSETVDWPWHNSRVVEAGSPCLVNARRGVGRAPTYMRAHQAFTLARATRADGAGVYVVCYAVEEDRADTEEDRADTIEYFVVGEADVSSA